MESEARTLETLYRHLKSEWRDLWDRKLDDRWVAEAMARREYAVLFVGKGDVVSASRKTKSPDFREILETHEKLSGERLKPIDPSVGNYRKFIRDEIMPLRRQKRQMPKKETATQGQKKKDGRGWLHA